MTISSPGVVRNGLVNAVTPVGRALLLDRDGVINVNHGYVHTREKTDWVPGIFDFCREAMRSGYAIFVITNQAGIARGYYSESQFEEYTEWVHSEFSRRAIDIVATYYCPHHPLSGGSGYSCECECRKPAPGMLLASARDYGVDLAASIMVGDKASDMLAASSAGVGTLLLLDPAGDQRGFPARTLVCASLESATGQLL